MAEHKYSKEDLINRFDKIINKTLEDIDNKKLFNQVKDFKLQKGIVGCVIEQCVLEYSPNSNQEPDLIVVENGKEIKTELKTTGMVLVDTPNKHFIAKEPMSITAVGIFDLNKQCFYTSHFWQKLEHMLIVYYHYDSPKPVSPYDYRKFPIKGYEFHEFSEDDKEALKQDWDNVFKLVDGILKRHNIKNGTWKRDVENEYIEIHGELRPKLNFIDLVPKYPPRFRLKQPVVSAMIANHFGDNLEQLPGKYIVISDIDDKCRKLEKKYGGKTIFEIAAILGIALPKVNKGISEQIIVAMFGGKSKRMHQIELFNRFGLIGKTVVMTPSGGRTEDMKLFHVDFKEMVQLVIEDEDEKENRITRDFTFEDSTLYSYFADHEFLCILFEEPAKDGRNHSLYENKFIGFERLVFSQEFIDKPVRKLWKNTRDKIKEKKLVDVVKTFKDGRIKSAPNFMKSRENVVFLRGSGIDSSLIHKTEIVNGIKMLPQYVWLKGSAIVDAVQSLRRARDNSLSDSLPHGGIAAENSSSNLLKKS